MNNIARQITESDLREALRKDEFVLFHQPKVSLLQGDICGSEVLVRWIAENGTIIQPDEFIPLAEKCGVLQPITLRMLELSVQAITELEEKHPSLSVSMNVTPIDLELHNVSRRISELLSAGAVKPDQLQIEITESIAMGDFDRVYDDIIRLNDMGIKVLMDDFGTGYSSIDRLSQLPFSSLKLDKGVVKRMGTSIQNLDVVRSSISMARELRMTSVAEGVEDEGAYNFLVANGCEEAQGFWISRPITLDHFLTFLEEPHDFSGSQIGRVHQALYNVFHYRKSLIDAAYCFNKSTDSVLDSVIHPEVRREASHSRFGLWYYGVGQKINHVSGFNEMEQPFLALHKCGLEFMEQLQAPMHDDSLSDAIAALDVHMDQLTSALRRLERELLRHTA